MFNKFSVAVQTYYKAAKYFYTQNKPQVVKEIQTKKLRKLIMYSYENIKYYRELFDSYSIDPQKIQSLSDMKHIPILTKEQLRKRFWDMLPRQLPLCRVSRTSGSTGIPVCILSDLNSRIHNSAAVVRYRKNLGINFAGRTILCPLKNEDETYKPPHWTFLQGIHKTFYINPYSSKISDIEYSSHIVKRLNEPAIIGITPAIRALAWQIKDQKLPPIHPSAVLTTGEYLDTKTRDLLESTFGIQITDIYACNEAGDIAWQCFSGRYHINAENCLVEIIGKNGPAKEGEIGEVVITNLNRYSMPFIRYKNGDLAISTQQKCDCGCQLPMLVGIVGRAGEDIYLPNGKSIPWNQLKGFMNHADIRQFQIVQNHDYSITIKYVPEIGANRKQLEKILFSRFYNLLKGQVVIEFLAVKIIPVAPSGKSKLVVTHIGYPPREN